MKYTVKTKGESEFDTVIEISGLTAELSINELLDSLENSQRIAKETHSNMQVVDIFLKTAEEKMPELAKISEDSLALATEYFMKKAENRTAQMLMDSCKASIDKYTTHLKAIEEETGIKCLPEIAPFQIVDLENHG